MKTKKIYDAETQIIIHELGNLFMLMGFSLNMLEKQDSKISELEYFKYLKDDTNTAIKLIKDARELSSVYNANMLTKNMGDMIHNIVVKYRELAESYGIKFQFENKISPYVLIKCNEMQMESLIGNIIKNAIEELNKCNKKRKRIIVSLSYGSSTKETNMKNGNVNSNVNDNKNNVIIEINNNGNTLSSEEKKKIFEDRYSGKESGLGIGLSLCRDIVIAHGGKLKVKSSIKKGTSFFIDVPIIASEAMIEKKEIADLTI